MFDLEHELKGVVEQQLSYVPIKEVSVRWAWLSQTPLKSQTDELRALGFQWAGDFEIISQMSEENKAEPVEVPPLAAPHASPKPLPPSKKASESQRFIRLFLYPEHSCFATLSTAHTVFTENPPLVKPEDDPLIAAIVSVWKNENHEVLYTTTNRPPDFNQELTQMEGMLLTRRHNATPTELTTLHLQRRRHLSNHVDLPLLPLNSVQDWLQFTERNFVRLKQHLSQLLPHSRELVRQKKAFRRLPQAQSNYEDLGLYEPTIQS